MTADLREYEAPELVELGSLDDLTQGADNFGTDGPQGGAS